MTITQARKKIENLKCQISDDKKVDISEVNKLLLFIEDYVRAENQDFVNFKLAILKCASDGSVDDEYVKILVNSIDKISYFLKIEQIVEWAFFGITGTMMICYLVYLFLK